MFTGIVEETGTVAQVTAAADSIRLQVRSKVCGEDARLGDSIAVNGCCLTVVDVTTASDATLLTFDLLRETWNRTNLSACSEDSAVNLERAMPANGRVHGHFVTGHIDGTGRIQIFEERGADWYLRVQASADLLRYIVFKGSIAVDGISLTVAEVTTDTFAVWIIPHTFKVTALRERKAGQLLNIEADLLAKYVEKLTAK
ncbi:MAG: riboflavin synthase [Limisphaerales bacterium]